jgi:methylaspartate mutase sigma subunit
MRSEAGWTAYPVTRHSGGLISGIAAGPRLNVVVAGTASDAHTWNLVFLQLLFEDWGHRVRNLGACVPEDTTVAECLRLRPDLIVVSTVNGHGIEDGLSLARKLRSRAELAITPAVIGGKLAISGPIAADVAEGLIQAGFDAVYNDDADRRDELMAFVREIATRTAS